ncbi:MAG: TRAP transporter small permease [Pseudomonadota bacterium]
MPSSRVGPVGRGLLGVFDRVSAALALAAGICILMLAVLITIDILGRDFLGVSVQGTDEIGGYVLAFVGSLGMALTLLRRGHPRIDLFLKIFPATIRDGLTVFAQVTMAMFALFMAWQALGEFRNTLRFGAITNTPLETPLWVPQAIWLGGVSFFALAACLTSAHALRLMFGNRTLVARYYGSPTVEEEVQSYTEIDRNEAADAGR